MHTVYTKDRLSWSGPKPVPTERIGEFVSITRVGKQRSPISIVHRSLASATPLSHVCRRHRHELLCHIALSGVWPRAHVMDHVPRGFIPQSDWFLKIFRGNGRQKIYGNATRPLIRMGPGDEATYFWCSKWQTCIKWQFFSPWLSLLFFSHPLCYWLSACHSTVQWHHVPNVVHFFVRGLKRSSTW